MAESRSRKKKQPDTDGWADETFLIKYRLISANEENGGMSPFRQPFAAQTECAAVGLPRGPSVLG